MKNEANKSCIVVLYAILFLFIFTTCTFNQLSRTAVAADFRLGIGSSAGNFAYSNQDGKLNRKVVGFYAQDYPGDMLAYDSLACSHADIDTIAVFNCRVDGTGNLINQSTNHVVDLAKRENVKALLLVHNFNNYIDKDAAHKVLLEENRNNLEENLLYTIRQNGFDGVNIDLEGVPPGDRENYIKLLTELKELFSPHGYLLTVSIPAETRDNPKSDWSGAYEYSAIGEIADLVILMTYDEHWSGGEPGPVASLPWVQQVLDYALETIPKEKTLMGIAAYGYDWSAGKGHVIFWNGVNSLADKYGGAKWNDKFSSPFFTYYDEKGYKHEVWFENKYSLRLKLDLANCYNIAGIAVWRLGFEDSSFWQTVSEKF
ncbi:glycosyl hydrolase family 18 protein [Pelotomaculum isophthalicicum JI]|uniref:Glycosyl hydrolase family 18 protein n=1 Tax=Pelotomaculum isophthalicicum JI TaxID=947010 RepID=A0A9X4H5P8_9FIRM|nr:glycosyl hydrolase family 18 protein [Pelotomaculum isophthalicicum]MDF9408627.1 glycosyl hydrolase family 18 protein [Pelotomaculum isophthalicicum JI]